MKKIVVLLTVTLLAGSSVGCIGAPVVPPLGLLYTNMDAPIFGGAGDVGSRRGEASVTAILGLFSWGDGSVKAAAANGGISDVKRVDYHFTNVIGIYQHYTTVVHGN